MEIYKKLPKELQFIIDKIIYHDIFTEVLKELKKLKRTNLKTFIDRRLCYRSFEIILINKIIFDYTYMQWNIYYCVYIRYNPEERYYWEGVVE